jgi:hypothetical protein
MPVGIDSITNRRPSITGSDPAWLACDPLYCMRKTPLHTVNYWRQSVAHPPRLQSSIVSCSPLEGDCRPPRRRTANRTREGPVFFCANFAPDLQGCGFLLRYCRLRPCAGAQADLAYPGSKQTREEHHGLDDSHPRRDLHRARDQRLPAGRVLIPDALRRS